MKEINKIYKGLKSGLIILAAALLFSSCEKVIDIDLNETDPKLVVNGGITAGPGPHVVELSMSTDYFMAETPPAAEGAVVTISDDQGRSTTLVETSPGRYETQNFEGIPNRTYEMNIQYKGEQYKAGSYLWDEVAIDSLSYKYSEGLPPFTTEGYYVTMHAPEHAGLGQAYRIKVYKNDSLFDGTFDILIANDDWVDGNYINWEAPYNFKVGDTVTVDLISITAEEYKYWEALQFLLNPSGLFDPPPANPPTNLSNGAMGFFTANNISRKEIVIK